jgi:hypothetical protein
MLKFKKLKIVYNDKKYVFKNNNEEKTIIKYNNEPHYIVIVNLHLKGKDIIDRKEYIFTYRGITTFVQHF